VPALFRTARRPGLARFRAAGGRADGRTRQEVRVTTPDDNAVTEERRPAGDDTVRALVVRLARRHPSGGKVVERAAILAEGADCAEVEAWIVARGGRPEATVAPAGRGLHGSRFDTSVGGAPRAPARYVLPADALAPPD
jgi:hypothetical protein